MNMFYSSPTTTTPPSHHNKTSSENGDDTSPPPSVSAGRPTPSPTSGLTTPPGMTSPTAFAPSNIMATSSNSPPLLSSSMMNTSLHSIMSNSPSSMHPYHHPQHPSIPHPHIIDHLTLAERMSLLTRSASFMCAPQQPKVKVKPLTLLILYKSHHLSSYQEKGAYYLFKINSRN